MELIRDRRALHQIPELDHTLTETMAYLRSVLEPLACTVFVPAEGSLCARFDFGMPSTIAFRADADALPIPEQSGADYASRHPGCMHACGHDGHMAIVLELARRLAKKEHYPYNVLLIFQCAEETTGGAHAICESSVLEGVTALFGLHLWPGLPAGKVYSRPGELMARSCEVTVDIEGKSAHIAKAAEGIDATAAGVYFYNRAQALEKSLPPTVFRLLKFGKFQSGTARNALSAHCHLEGSLRAFQDHSFHTLRSGLETIAQETKTRFGCELSLHFSDGYPAVMNPRDLFSRVCRAVEVQALDTPSMTAEDFSWYQKYVPAVFFFLGLGDTPALHADTFDFDDALLKNGADFFERLGENLV